MHYLKYLGYGWLILGVAIVINGAVKLVGGTTWYDYIGKISNLGVKTATLSLHPAEVLFLFIIYPAIFGIIVFLAVLRIDKSR